MTSINRDEFLAKFNLSSDLLTEIGLAWEDLVAIADDYVDRMAELDRTAQDVASRVRAFSEVHSLRYRVKDPVHLLEKIIRKKRENTALQVTVGNYPEHIQDLAGVRAMHLFKADWLPIHEKIGATWDLVGQPQANVREGDPENIVKLFEQTGCEVKRHPQGYRSVHYLLRVKPTKWEHVVELQVRTLFEEGWSEIDHRFAYPHSPRGAILNEFLAIFNRLAGSADEMGSYVATLDRDLGRREAEYAEVMARYEKSVKELSAQVQQLKITEDEKRALTKQIKKLESERPVYPLLNLGQGLNLKTGTLFTTNIFGNVGDPDMFSGILSAGNVAGGVLGGPAVTEVVIGGSAGEKPKPTTGPKKK